ncbi:zf-HC2 domain-containing protein [Arthrobacter sp. QXT-31]|uniref:zf-HC2 domain-containing protein n=1 Tax=Arthrobacter sp. QXT-31 TaxID=1357915 RepID=UPI000971A3E4|nr:zf-HC2 domain-containing protein [Arthrobacter sp. QXT-31]APX00515.1 hypothetical protein BWQ92_01180 [Arthrobacter sp. QXT-31]
MNTNETDSYRHWAAVYVLGALDPGERGEYETHLAICAKCSAAVAELAGLPELLDTLAPVEAQAIGRSTPRPDVFGRLAGKFPRETRLLLAALGAGVRAANCGGDGTARSGRR